MIKKTSKIIALTLIVSFLLSGCMNGSTGFNEDSIYIVKQMNSPEILSKEYDSFTLTQSLDGEVKKIIYNDGDVRGTVELNSNTTDVKVEEGFVEYGLKESGAYYENILIKEFAGMWDLSEYLDLDGFDFIKAEKSNDLIVIRMLLSEDKLTTYIKDHDLSSLDIKQIERYLTINPADYSLMNIEEKLILNDKKEVSGGSVEIVYNSEADQRIKEVIDHHRNSESMDLVKVLINENTKYEILREYKVPTGAEISVELTSDQVLNDVSNSNGIITYHISDHSVDGIKDNEGITDPYDSSDFVLLTDYVPDVILEIRYYSTYNFVGERIPGYEEPIALLTKECAIRLKEVADELRQQGYRLKIFDAYRPTVAEDYFVSWCNDLDDQRMKAYFYPYMDKSYILARGYLANRTGHNRGSTLDLTLFDMSTGKEVDMGYPFDYFGEESHPDYTGITEEQYNNRMILREAMMAHNFRPFEGEWWHFIMNDEPYPNTNFSFPVSKKVLKDYN